MNTGLLWFDNDPSRTIAAKVTDAARCFAKKFDAPPSICYVSSRSVKDDMVIPFDEGEIKIVPVSNILVNHFLVGVESG